MELPTEILLHIFSEVLPSPRNAYVDRKPVLTTRQHLSARNDLQACLLVCKRWNYAATYTLWSEPEFFSCHSFIQFLCSVSHCSSFLKIIRLATAADELDAVWLQEKTHESKKLQSSRLYRRNLIHRLAFTPCVMDTQRYPADCPVPKYIQDGHIHVMSENLFYLTSISLEDCVNLTDNSVMHLIVNNHHLVSVDLTNCRKITNVTVQAIAKLCTRLQYLSLRGCGQVTDQGIWDLRSLNLKKVDLSWCRRVSDSGVRHLVTGSEDLHPACKKRASDILGRLDNVNQNESRTSASYKPQSQLVELRMTGCHRVIGDGLINLVKDLFLPLKNGQTATPLSTFEFSMPHGESAYFDSASTIFELLPRSLLHLYIYDAYRIPEESLTILANCCSQLQSLTLHNCKSMRDDTLAYILSSMTQLRQLCLPSCKFLTSQAIKYIVNSQCSFTLTELDLSDIFHFDDEAVELLAADAEAFSLEKAANSTNSQRPLKLGLLNTLSLRNLSNVTIKSVLLLVRVLPNLHVLDVSGCGEGITDDLPGEESSSINRLADDNHVGDMYNVGGFCRISGERLEELKI